MLNKKGVFLENGEIEIFTTAEFKETSEIKNILQISGGGKLSSRN